MDGIDGIPRVDLGAWRRGSGPNRRAWAERLCTTCHEVGFFVVTGHGVDPSSIRSMFELSARLFALPPQVKARIDKRASRHFRGWEPVGSELTNHRPDLREQVDLWTEHPARPADVEPPYLRLLGPNRWLPDALLPGGRAQIERWTRAMGEIADALLDAMGVGLGLGEGHFRRLFGAETMSLLKLIRYPPTPDGGAGVNAHHDTGFLTVLATDGTPGLEIEGPDRRWIPAPAPTEDFIVNLGEMLQAMTGQYFVATPHRVVTARPRRSIGYFHGPALDTELTPLTLDPKYARAVRASPRHAGAGFMPTPAETAAGLADMASRHRPDRYGEQLWNYFLRSYPEIVRRHYPDAISPPPP